MTKNNAIGIDIGGTNLRIALVSEEGKVLRKKQYPSREDILTNITNSLDELIEENTVGIGIAVAGLIDRRKRTVLISPNLPSVEGIDFGNLLSEKFSKQVIIENDANSATLGEKYIGVGKDLNSFVLMTLGTGIGGGVIYNGELMDIPSEVGHMTVEPAGIRCDCGNRGCLEEYSGAKAMIYMATSALEKGEKSSLKVCCEGNIYRINPQIIYEHAMDGDRLSRDILRTAGKYLGIGIANLTNILHPEAFILTGGLTNAWEIYIEEAIKEVDKRALKGLFRKDMIKRSSIREDAGLIGAALYALRSISNF